MVMITRGGVIPGGMLAEAMDITHILTAAVDFPAQTMQEKAKLIAWPQFIQFPADDKLRGRPTLIVADVWGSGRTITAVKNAQLAQSPLVLLGGATASILKGRGSLQDIDQMALMRRQVKWSAAATRVRDIPRLLSTAFFEAQDGVPGPVFVELPIDLLYDEKLVREWFDKSGGGKLLRWYLHRYLGRLFEGDVEIAAPRTPRQRHAVEGAVPPGYRSFGFNTSRSQSPRTLTDSTMAIRAAPGKMVIHHSPEKR